METAQVAQPPPLAPAPTPTKSLRERRNRFLLRVDARYDKLRLRIDAKMARMAAAKKVKEEALKVNRQKVEAAKAAKKATKKAVKEKDNSNKSMIREERRKERKAKALRMRTVGSFDQDSFPLNTAGPLIAAPPQPVYTS